jgi:hypothetical protein
MAVYVDNGQARFRRMIMSHMIADTTEELLAMADEIGVSRKWIQAKGTYTEHFDVCMKMRDRAVEAGAKEITQRELGMMLRTRRRRNMGSRLSNEEIAQVCHEANRAYCATIGDNSQLPWNEAPDWQKQSAIKGVEFHLASLKNGVKPSPSASHDAWLLEKQQDGWSYGPVKDVEKKEHPCYVAYEQLPVEQRLKDYIFAGIVESVFTGQSSEAPK